MDEESKELEVSKRKYPVFRNKKELRVFSKVKRVKAREDD